MVSLTTRSKIQKLKAQIKRLEQNENTLKARKQARALERISNLVKTSGLSVAQVNAALKKYIPKKNINSISDKTADGSKLTGRKIEPKYRNPLNSQETWTGRGRAPKWAAELKMIGELENALIR